MNMCLLKSCERHYRPINNFNTYKINLKICKLFHSVIGEKVFSKDSNVLKLTKFINAFIVDTTYLTKSLIILIGLF